MSWEISKDRFGGLTIALNAKTHAGLDAAKFGVQLSEALKEWSDKGTRGLWLRVPAPAAHLIDPAVMLGFDFHHARPGYVMLTKWLPGGTSSLPAYPHHQVGVGGLVLNGRGQVLCIQERQGLTAGLADFWKLPGGLVDGNEDICEAAVREVLEETGVRTTFDRIAAFRETHSGPFGCTDLYLICLLKLDSSYGSQVPQPKPQESEIAAAEWRELRALLDSPFYAKGLYGSLLRTAAAVALQSGAAGEGHLGLEQKRMKGLTGRPESMYYAGDEAAVKARL